MELSHQFEVPVGIEQAWEHLLDMEKVAACFPGATLTSADGHEYTGSVKIKLGPIQLTYKGSARIEEADATTHTAKITASGSAARSGSTASMTVVATAKPVTDDRTAVSMDTDLMITGRPAQFGRGVMAEVGDKILGKFADCLSATLAATDAPAEAAAPADSKTPSEAKAAADSGEQRPPAAAANAGPTSAATSYTRTPQPEPIDLLASARGSIVKRLAPIAAALVVVLVWRLLRRKKN